MREASMWTVAVVFIGLALLVPMVNVGYEGTTQSVQTTNETVVVNYSQPSSVDEPSYALGFEPNATVYNTSGVELVNETDYEWRPSNGTIEWFNTSSTVEGENASATYEYRAPPKDARELRTALHPMSRVLGLLVLVVGAGATIKYGTGGF